MIKICKNENYIFLKHKWFDLYNYFFAEKFSNKLFLKSRLGFRKRTKKNVHF